MNKEILPFGEIWMDLEGVRLNEINQAEETTTVWYHLFVESKKKLNSKKQNILITIRGREVWELERYWPKGPNLRLEDM